MVTISMIGLGGSEREGNRTSNPCLCCLRPLERNWPRSKFRGSRREEMRWVGWTGRWKSGRRSKRKWHVFLCDSEEKKQCMKARWWMFYSLYQICIHPSQKQGCVHSVIGTFSNSYQESMSNIRNGWMEIGNRISASAWMSFHISDKSWSPCVDAHA